MAIVGGALVPVLQGALADVIGVQHAFVVAALCYLYVAWYGPRGSTPSSALATADTTSATATTAMATLSDVS
jgi:FHS family L-fucose permease-like MFS transporter